jgi:hypothetical protein
MVGRLTVTFVAAAAAMVLAASASASHSWGNYHWARTANPFTVPLGDNVDSTWDVALSGSSVDWTKSTVLNAPVVAGGAGNGKRCRANAGRIEVCNAFYGNNGWLGLATIWTSGSHIVRATTKVNDTYFSTATYNSPTKRSHVMCQEVGHGFGLDHQDESGADLNTCMDYSRALDNPHPNAHDYAQLETIYNSHLDSTSTVGSFPEGEPRSVRREDRISTSYIEEDFGNGFKRHTFIEWALSERGR